MQIIPLGSDTLRDRASDRAAASRPVAPSERALSVLPVAPATASAWPASAEAALPLSGLSVWNPQLNAQLSSAQQAVLFLDRLSSRLQMLKSDLGSAVAGAPVPQERLESQRQAVSQLWASRASQAGGQLDGRLLYSQDAAATQGFGVRGLDVATLQSAPRETLAVALGTPTPARPAALVVLEPGLDERTLARRFDQALAPLGVRASLDDQQQLRFSVPEPQWPAVRDALSIRGEGRRFPSGPFNRVRTEAEPAVMAPDAWSLQSGPAGRQALQQIVEAQGHVERARDAAHEVLQQTGRGLDAAAAAQDAAWAGRYARGFAAMARASAPDGADGAPAQAQQARYQTTMAIGASLPAIGRQRIHGLLALPAG